jgi:glycosyltransferase involved in cell wall biosynthesis|tara:strand:+ start:4477 stop:5106 length:630 start_codon:yes stop_codon:yes gene_type:complete
MKISYAITVCNEFLEIQKLLSLLLNQKRIGDEIVVLVDLSKNTATSELMNYLHELSSEDYIILVEDTFKGHFANWKNILTKACSGDYIFQIDADEIPHDILIEQLPQILENNPDNEVYLVPRVNTVSGLTQEHIAKWRWNVDAEDRVNWPDYQWRIWKNKPEIQWKNKVHEVLNGHLQYGLLPATPELALYHPKTIKRQQQQNDYYDTL